MSRLRIAATFSKSLSLFMYALNMFDTTTVTNLIFTTKLAVVLQLQSLIFY